MLELLFKQMGFNPADLKKQMDGAVEQFNIVIAHFNERLDAIEKTQHEILTLLKKDVP